MRKLIVSNFRQDTTEEELVELFTDYGLESVVLKPGKYAVLTFGDQGDAERAMEDMGGGKVVSLGLPGQAQAEVC